MFLSYSGPRKCTDCSYPTKKLPAEIWLNENIFEIEF